MDPSKPHPWNDDEIGQFARAHVRFTAEAEPERMRPLLPAGVDVLTLVSPAMRARLDEEARGFAAEHMTDLATWFQPDHAGYALTMTRMGWPSDFWGVALHLASPLIVTAYADQVRHDASAAVAYDTARYRLTEAAAALPAVLLDVHADGLLHV